MVEQHFAPATMPTMSCETYDEFEGRLIRALGATVGGESLTKALGFRSQEAFRKAHQRGRLPVRTFEIDGRRGRFASATDIAAWLWGRRSPETSGRCSPTT
jgi:hypothetical protein